MKVPAHGIGSSQPHNVFVFLFLFGYGAANALSADQPSATPYRPSVANPAALPFPGYIEIEAGLERTRDVEPKRRDSLPVLFKYAFTQDVGLLIGGDAYVRQNSDLNGRVSGAGDTSLTLKLHRAINDALAVGLEAGVKLPTAKDLIGSGKSDRALTGIVSLDLGEAQLDLNLGRTRLGLATPGESRNAYNFAGALSHPMSEQWGVTVEISAVRRRGAPRMSQFLGAISYVASKTVVLDAGMAWGLTKASAAQIAFVGVTVLIK